MLQNFISNSQSPNVTPKKKKHKKRALKEQFQFQWSNKRHKDSNFQIKITKHKGPHKETLKKNQINHPRKKQWQQDSDIQLTWKISARDQKRAKGITFLYELAFNPTRMKRWSERETKRAMDLFFSLCDSLCRECDRWKAFVFFPIYFYNNNFIKFRLFLDFSNAPDHRSFSLKMLIWRLRFSRQLLMEIIGWENTLDDKFSNFGGLFRLFLVCTIVLSICEKLPDLSIIPN